MYLCCSNSRQSLIFWTNWTTVIHVIILHEPRVTQTSETDASNRYSKRFQRRSVELTVALLKFCIIFAMNKRLGGGGVCCDIITHHALSLTHIHTQTSQHKPSLSRKGYEPHKSSTSLPSSVQFSTRMDTWFALHMITKKNALWCM